MDVLDASCTTLTDHGLPCRFCNSDTLEQLAWHELVTGIDNATMAANIGGHCNLFGLARAAETIRDALAAIEPVQDGDTPGWTVAVRRAALGTGLVRAHRAKTWTVDTLNTACATALAITAGRDRDA